MSQGSQLGLHRLGPGDLRATLRFLRQHTAHNAYLLGQINRGGLVEDHVAGPFWGFFRDDSLQGIACTGSNLVISYPASDLAIEAFAQAARRGLYLVRVAIGEDATLDRFMGHYGRGHSPIALERGDQRLFSLRPNDLLGPEPEVEIRPVEVMELESIMEIDRLMITEELGFNPFRKAPRIYREGWLRRIRETRVWVVGPEQGPYLFKVEQSAISDDVVQISGVYTATQYRRRGVATDALAQMCVELFKEVSIISLYVHRENVSAMRLYQRLGFEELGRIRSVWFDV